MSSQARRPPDAITPKEFAEHFGVSERRVRAMARSLGACRIFGKTMVLLPEDVDAILEAAKPSPQVKLAHQVTPKSSDEARLIAERDALLERLTASRPSNGRKSR